MAAAVRAAYDRWLERGRQMKEGRQIAELSEKKAAKILKNVFEACGVPENKTPFHELQRKYQKMADGVKDGE